MRMIWATRGRSWGFRFLRDGELSDPLPEYERAFSSAPAASEVCHHLDDAVALRFPDPDGRRDTAGRSIVQSFVIFAPDAEQITSVEEGIRRVWPTVAEEYASRWSQARGASGESSD